MPFREVDVGSLMAEAERDKELELENKKARQDELIEKLIQVREERSISQRELAERIGVSQQTIARFESRQTIPEPGTITKILDVLDIEVSGIQNNRDVDFR